LHAQLAAAGWQIAGTPGPIVRLPALEAAAEKKLKQQLLAAGIYPPFLKYGAAAPGIFRFVISSEHTRGQLRTLAGVLTEFIGRKKAQKAQK
jgi:7-keto-8-aminopelargonate synthetase-like enzyme